MINFTVSITIKAPVETIAGALANPDNFPFWQKYLERFEVIRGMPGRTEAGSIGLLHYSDKGKSYTMEDRLLYCEPGKKYVSQVTSDFIEARVETTLATCGNKTEMILTWSGKGRILILKLLLPFLRGRMIRQSQTELETFRQLVETRGSDFRMTVI